MENNNNDITIPNGENIKGNNLLSKYVTKKTIIYILIKKFLNIQEYFYSNMPKFYKPIQKIAI